MAPAAPAAEQGPSSTQPHDFGRAPAAAGDVYSLAVAIQRCYQICEGCAVSGAGRGGPMPPCALG